MAGVYELVAGGRIRVPWPALRAPGLASMPGARTGRPAGSPGCSSRALAAGASGGSWASDGWPVRACERKKTASHRSGGGRGRAAAGGGPAAAGRSLPAAFRPGAAFGGDVDADGIEGLPGDLFGAVDDGLDGGAADQP